MYGTQTVMPCPECGCRMFGSALSNPLEKIGLGLKEKSFNICTNCATEVDMVKWKKKVWCK